MNLLNIQAHAEESKDFKKRDTYIDLFKDSGPAPAPDTGSEKRDTYIDLFKDSGPAPAPDAGSEKRDT